MHAGKSRKRTRLDFESEHVEGCTNELMAVESGLLTRELVETVLSDILAGGDEVSIAELLDGCCEEAGAVFAWDELLRILRELEDENVVLMRDMDGGLDGDLEMIHLL